LVAACFVLAIVGAPSMPTQAASPIRHVIIIEEENHSFDNVLGRYCYQASSYGRAACDGAVTGWLSSGRSVALRPEPELVPTVAHDIASQAVAINRGGMNGFDRIDGCRASDRLRCYSTLAPERIPNVAALATRFTVSDRTFELKRSPSWGGHLVLAAGGLDGFAGSNPRRKAKEGPGAGCDSHRDALWRKHEAGRYEYVPACVPDQLGRGPYRASPVRYVPTIFDRLNEAHLTWRLFAGDGDPHRTGKSGGWEWAICPSFFECLHNQAADHLVPNDRFTVNAKRGSLPNFSIVTPTPAQSEHNGNSIARGDNWIGKLVDAVENGPDWRSSVIFVTWDDCGCFYDHVAPPDRLGVRLPMVIVSPYAKAGATDSTVATPVSMLAFTEHNFGLRPLNRSDGSSYDYSNAFDMNAPDFTPARMTNSRVTVTQTTDDEDDPT
jgi:hypothetical protein